MLSRHAPLPSMLMATPRAFSASVNSSLVNWLPWSELKIDMALLVVASGLYRLLARRMRGYADAQARHIFRDLIDTPADVSVTNSEVRVRFHRRAHLPIILASGLLNTPVSIPWWSGYSLHM